MAQIKLNTIQIVLMAYYKKLLIQIVHMAHICKNDTIQIKDMFQIVAAWLQFSTEEYLIRSADVEFYYVLNNQYSSHQVVSGWKYDVLV